MFSHYDSVLKRLASAGTLCLLALHSIPGVECPPGCLAPACVCPSTAPPGGLAPSATPQLVLITFDDAVSSTIYQTVTPIIDGPLNPDGCPIRATFFVSTNNSDYWRIQQLYAAGHEIAVHTMTHSTDLTSTLAKWRAEIGGARAALSELAQIPLEEIVGFRAPSLLYSADSFLVLEEERMLYDCSIGEFAGSTTSPDVANLLWPYTLDAGVPQECQTGGCPAPHPGLFEIPMWSLHDAAGHQVATMDGPSGGAEMLALWKLNLVSRYAGNRAPLGIFLHPAWLMADPSRAAALQEFIAWAQTLPDVWFVSCRDLVAFMQAPETAATALTAPPWGCPDRPAACVGIDANGDGVMDGGDVNRCSYAEGWFHTCADCPPAFPKPVTTTDPDDDDDDLPPGLTPIPGSAELELMDEWGVTTSWELHVVNESNLEAETWTIAIQLENGTLSSLWNAVYELDGDLIRISPADWQPPLAPGATHTVYFMASEKGGSLRVSIEEEQYLAKLQLPNSPPIITRLEITPAGYLTLEWDWPPAASYTIQTRTSLNTGTWQTLAEVESANQWTGLIPLETRAGYIRILFRGTP